MKKLLFAASTLSHIENFHIPYLKYLKKMVLKYIFLVKKIINRLYLT
ncbi:hypothetical protein MT361_19780 [Clostridium butyricum]|nr:hypothetical protein [Clostridium butyricum]MDI9210787.1 hypothetical protein [Clostridium butyricum]